jgi:ribosomal-protein-alanine N-acetyltransferase
VSEAARVRPLTPADAIAIATWRYPPPFDFYDSGGDPGDFAPPDDEGLGYYVLETQQGELVGFCCLGPEGRVPGQTDEPGTLDVGMGLRPDAVSQGVASQSLPLVLDLARQVASPLRLRTAVAAFNERSLRLCRRAGFVEVRRFDGPRDQLFVELVRDL